MLEQAGPELDQEVARLVLGERPSAALPFSTDNASADLLLWRLAQSGVAFKVQELEELHHCMLWDGRARPREGLATGSSGSRPLAICLAVLRLYAGDSRRGGAAGTGLSPRPDGQSANAP